jgi:hypothetical protein
LTLDTLDIFYKKALLQRLAACFVLISHFFQLTKRTY